MLKGAFALTNQQARGFVPQANQTLSKNKSKHTVKEKVTRTNILLVEGSASKQGLYQSL